MRYLIFIIYCVFFHSAHAQEWEEQRIFNPDAESATLRILSSTDTALFAPILDDFIQRNANIKVEYLVNSTANIDTLFRASPEAFDIVISSAMDLQFRLANDGFAQPIENVVHPAWAQWRQSLFAFTSEAAAIVINKKAFDGLLSPRSRQDLILAMRERPEVFRNSVGTYDVRESGLGYLFATQDARASETYWRLMEVFGGANTKLYCCSGDMIDDLINGRIAVAYNVLGSYAEARPENGKSFEVVELTDFRTIMMRTALVSSQSKQPEKAAQFMRHLLQYQQSGRNIRSKLPSLIMNENSSARRDIGLEPALMTFLDSFKRRKFLKAWENALIQK